MRWTVADASRNLGEVLHQADREAQVITQHDREYLVLPRECMDRSAAGEDGLIKLLLNAPKVEGFEPMPRTHEPMRVIDL